MLEQIPYFLFCEEYSALRQSDLYHLLLPPSKTDSTSTSNTSGKLGKYKMRECSPGRSTRYEGSLLLNSADRSQLVAVS